MDGAVTGGFADKVANFTRDNKGSEKDFTGLLKFLGSYQYIMNDTGLLTGVGGNTEFGRGVAFWNRYGRTLFNASTAQLQYEPTFAGNGSARPKVALRTTSQSRIQNSQINWALGFFGPSYNSTPDQSLTHWESPFNLTIITEGGTENNTLASYDSCFSDNNQTNLDIAAIKQDAYKKIYLRSAVQRLSAHLPKGFNLTVQDVYAMQMTCAYEYAFVSMSDFCGLFTADEWAGFENVLDIQCKYRHTHTHFRLTRRLTPPQTITFTATATRPVAPRASATCRS